MLPGDDRGESRKCASRAGKETGADISRRQGGELRDKEDYQG